MRRPRRRIKRWDVAEYLTTDEEIVAYIQAVFEEGDADLIEAAADDVARICGLEPVAGGDARGR